MPISLKSTVGAGEFNPTFFSGGLQIAAGASGTILTLTPPLGMRVRLVGLNSTGEAGISVTADGNPVVTNLSLNNGTGVGGFAVGKATSSPSTGQAALLDFIDAKSSIAITKVSGSTSVPILYSYAYGEL